MYITVNHREDKPRALDAIFYVFTGHGNELNELLAEVPLGVGQLQTCMDVKYNQFNECLDFGLYSCLYLYCQGKNGFTCSLCPRCLLTLAGIEG